MFKELLEYALDPICSEIGSISRSLSTTWGIDHQEGQMKASMGGFNLNIDYGPSWWNVTLMKDNQKILDRYGKNANDIKDAVDESIKVMRKYEMNDGTNVHYEKRNEWAKAPGFPGRYDVKAKLPAEFEVPGMNAGGGGGGYN